MWDMDVGKRFSGVVGAWIAALAVVALLSGCGDSSAGGDSSGSEPLTKAQFIGRASAICRGEESRKTRALSSASKRRKNYLTGSHRELEDLVAKAILPLYAEMIDELAELDPPASDRPKVEHIISRYEKTLEEAEANPGRLVTDDSFVQVNRLAERYGIEDCTL
jgi:hypothetical protein